MKTEISRLKLFSPLFYVPCPDSDPFGYRGISNGLREDDEKIFCFKLDETQAMEFEPDKTIFLGTLIFCGRNITDTVTDTVAGVGEARWELPPGDYLFSQKREILSRSDIIDMAVEIQQEGLWQKLQPGEKLYLRYLFEDGRDVTQLFRPYTEF